MSCGRCYDLSEAWQRRCECMSAPEPKHVLGFVFNPDFTRVILIEKKKPAWQAGFFNGLGGAIDAGEYPDTAMRREFREECGLDIPEGNWFKFANLVGADFSVACYWATETEFFLWQHASPTDEFVCFPRLDRLSNLRPLNNLQWLIEMAKAHASRGSHQPVLTIQYP